VVFVSGFAASALEVVLLLGFQALYGSLYRQVGLVVTGFMGGLAVGAWRAQADAVPCPDFGRPSGRSWPAFGDVRARPCFVCSPLPSVSWRRCCRRSCPTSVAWTPSRGLRSQARAMVLLLTFGLAALVGALFPLAGATVAGETAVTASRLYTADFVGAALGALLVSTLLVPLLGATMVCFFTAALNLAAAAIAWKPRRSA